MFVKKRMGRETANPKYTLALLLYMAGETRDNIAERVGVAKKTVSDWTNKNHWKERRAGQTITRPELVNKILTLISKKLDEIIGDEEAVVDTSLTDQLIKLASSVEKLDRKNNVVNDMETFMGFNQFLQRLSAEDKALTSSVLKFINQYQDKYITERISTRS